MTAYRDALAALADPTRRQVLERLRKGPMPVGRIAEGLPVSRPAVSQHLKVLADAGLVRQERHGTQHLYRVEPGGLVGLRRWLDGFWTDALEAFAAHADAAPPAEAPKRPARPRPPARTKRKT